MPAATRLLVAFLLLVGAFVVLLGVAVLGLHTVGQSGLAFVVAAAGVAGVVAGGVTYWILQRDVEEALAMELPPQPQPGVQPQPATALPARSARVRRPPMRVQAMPVADLPPAYVDAVLRGARARLNALKAGARHPLEGGDPRH